MKNNEIIDNINLENNINKKSLVIFEETLEYINSKEIDLLIDKIIQTSLHSSINSSNKTQESIFLKNNINNFPYYIGSFKHSLNKLLHNNQNRELYYLYESFLKEIRKIYYGYTHVEQKMYVQMNKYIKFKNAENNTPLEIISKLKEIGVTLKETIKFIEEYLYKNFIKLKSLFKKTDEKLREKIGIKSLSLYFLLDIFELPNNELSYMLMFKVIDEVSCILKYITDELSNSIQNENMMPNNQMNNIINKKDNQSNLLNDNPQNARNAMIRLKDKYVLEIYESLIKLDEYNIFRAKYYNKYLYTKGNYQVDTNKYLFEDNYEFESEMSESFLQINSLMDEELIINRFIEKFLINEFLDFFETQLSSFYKTNKKLIYLHSFQNNIIIIIVIYSFWNYYYGLLEIALFFIGRIIGKFLYNYLIKRRKRMKSLLLISNVILIISLILQIFSGYHDNYNIMNFISKFLIGFSYCKNIETRFILNYTPKLLIKRNIKKYFRIKYLSISIGFFFVSGITHLQSFINNINIKIDMIIISIISLIILVINILLFKEPKVEDIMNNEVNIKMNNLNGKKILEDNNLDDEEKIMNSSIESKLNTSDKKVNISYGKAKLISLKERNKVKILENALKLGAGKDHYEGTNHIFSILQDLINNENFVNSSYTNFSTRGHILFLTILYIIFSIIIFYNPLINTNKKEIACNNENKITIFKEKLWVFGFAYFLYYLILKLKCFSFQKNLSSWNFIMLLFILFEILLTSLFLVIDPFIFSKSTLIIFDNYYYIAYYSIILFFILIMEKICYKIMIREIPLEKTICKINIDNFLDILENFMKALIFAAFCFLKYFIDVNYDYVYKIIIIVLFLFSLAIFLTFNYKRKQFSLIKIINKVTYESF